MPPSTRVLRTLSACYAAICLIAVLTPPLIPIADPSRDVYWIVSALLCLAVLGSTWWPQLPRLLLLGAGWSLLALSLHLNFVLSDLLAMLTAMPLSVAVLSVLAGQVTPRTRRLLVALHVVVAGIWLGIAVVMVALTAMAAAGDDIATTHDRYALVELFDITILPWSSLATIMSGLAVSLTGKWGLVRHYWVLTKFVLALLVLASAFAFLHDWVVSAAEDSRRLMSAAGRGAELGTDPAWLVAGFGCAGGLVLAATVISVYKPWGRTRFGRRAVTSQARAPRSDRTVATGAR